MRCAVLDCSCLVLYLLIAGKHRTAVGYYHVALLRESTELQLRIALQNLEESTRHGGVAVGICGVNVVC